jgi:hypothetical protein
MGARSAARASTLAAFARRAAMQSSGVPARPRSLTSLAFAAASAAWSSGRFLRPIPDGVKGSAVTASP